MDGSQLGHLSPENGGCWYCQTDGTDNWLSSCEFDCALHQSCLEYEINNRKCNEDYYGELEIFMTEFEYYLDPHEHFAIRDEDLKLVYTKDNEGKKANICVFCRVFI